MLFVLIAVSLLAVWLTSMTAATVYISESNGVAEVVTDNISNINFGSVDQPNLVAANHPIIQSEAGYFKMLRFRVQSLGTSTTIKDLRFWKSAGVYVTGEVILRLNNPAQAYSQPNQTDAGAGSPIYTSDPGTAVVGIGGAYAGTIIAAPSYSNYILLAYTTTGSTPVGPVNQKTLTFQYDET